MWEISFLDIGLDNNIILYLNGDQTYMCNLQQWVTIFPWSKLILCFALCRHIYITWHILHVLRINKYIILWCVKCQMCWYQLHIWTSSVVIKLFACYLISVGLTPPYEIIHFDLSWDFWDWLQTRELLLCLLFCGDCQLILG